MFNLPYWNISHSVIYLNFHTARNSSNAEQNYQSIASEKKANSPQNIVVRFFQHFLHKHYYLIPWAQMGSELIAHDAEGRMGYWLSGHLGERNNIVLVKSNLFIKNIENKKVLAS